MKCALFLISCRRESILFLKVRHRRVGFEGVRAHHLLLEGEDAGDAAVDRVAEAGMGLEADGDDGVEALVGGDVEEQLGDVARAEHLVHRREVRRSLLRVEERREDAPAHALPPQKLAGPARPTAPQRSSSSSTSSAADAAPGTTTHVTGRPQYKASSSSSSSS